MRGNFFIVFDTLPQYLFLPREDVIFQDNTDYITTLFFKYTVNTADAKIMVTVDIKVTLKTAIFSILL